MARPSPVSVANRRVPFATACRWAGIEFYGESADRGVKVYCPFGDFNHPDQGRERSLRIYHDHGWCFAENRYFSPVSLLAEVWGVSREDAAARALDRIGYVPEDYRKRWELVTADPAPDLAALELALDAFCAGRFRGWQTAQYDPVVSRRRAECLGILPLVRTDQDCQVWLEACKKAMLQVLPPE